MIDLLCLGNVTIDDVVLSNGAEQPGCLGGDAIYAGLAARLWSDRVGIVAPVGNDFPAYQSGRLAALGFAVVGLPRRTVPTRHNQVSYRENGDRVWRVLSPGNDFATLSPRPADIPRAGLDARCALILAMDLSAQEELTASLNSAGMPIALDPQEDYIAGNEARIMRMLELVDIFLPSEIEVERLLGHRDFEDAARQFAACGCAIVVIKLGARGALLYDARADRFLRSTAAAARVVDTTGAGDAFSGGFAAAYARQRDPVAALGAGAVAASFAIEDFGANHMFEVMPTQAATRLQQYGAGQPQEARS